MRDIVEQGRLYIRAEAPDYYEKTVVWKMADEIERLREALREYTCDCENGCQGIRGEVCGDKARAALGEKE